MRNILQTTTGQNFPIFSSSRFTRFAVPPYEPELAFSFDLDFYRTNRATKVFDDAVTFARASSATYTDSDGVIQTATTNTPRVGHHIWDGSAWVNEGLLHESEARTNLLTYSEDLSNAAWSKLTGVTIGTPVTRNGISLDLIENDGADNFRTVSQSVGSVADGAYLTFSCFIEAGTSTETAIRVDDVAFGGSSNRVAVPITWTSGVPSLQADVTLGLTFVDASLQDWEDGVYRVHLTVLNGTGGALTLYPKYYVQWDETPAAVNTYAGGFQAEIGPTPSSYIPTSGSTVTRAAETLTIPAAKLPWPTPNVIGPELVTNGTFDTDISGWGDASSAGGSIAWNPAGYLDLVNTTGTSRAGLAVSVTAGKVYQISVDVVSLGGSTSAGFYLDNSATSAINFFVAGVGTHTVYYVTPDASLDISARNFSAGTTVSVDNISVREIDPLSVSIQMEGRMTYADSDASVAFAFLRWESDSSNRIFHILNTASTRTGRVDVAQVEAGVFDAVSSSDTTYAPGVLVPFNIASRHGSTFINAAIGGTAVTENTTPAALADLSSTNLTLGTTGYMGTIRTFRMWADDLGDTGIEEASS